MTSLINVKHSCHLVTDYQSQNTWLRNFGETVSTGSVSKFLQTYKRRSKTNLVRKNSARKGKLSEWDRRVLKRIAVSKKKTTVDEVTADLNQHLDFPVLGITFINSAGISRLLLTDVNAKRRLQSCNNYKTWSIGKQKTVLRSNE